MPENNIEFTLGYEALSLLGKGMYSNLWAALSELIANGIDANAEAVKVYIDLTVKEHSVIEIYDSGKGMTEKELKDKYVVVGQNKRNDPSVDPEKMMGRKGVGKLAALFLTSKYDICTKTKTSETTVWRFDFHDRTTTSPSLRRVDRSDYVLSGSFDSHPSGTLIKLYDVNLSNMAEEAINALRYIMANYFIYENLAKVQVEFFVNNGVSVEKCLKHPIPMKKKVAWKNMLAIVGSEESLSKIKVSTVSLPLEYQEYFSQQSLEHSVQKILFSDITESEGEYPAVKNGEPIKIKYKLSGWIGIHASIKPKEAQSNDRTFVKNRYYNPNKLRLYIRNKLAVEDFTSYLKSTQQGINYIEGEICFDLLDDNNLDDITTSNRQDLDAHDERVANLIVIVKKLINKLLAERNAVTKRVSDENEQRKKQIESRAKQMAKEAIQQDLVSLGVDEDKMPEIIHSIGNKFKGNDQLQSKEIFKLFISHSRRDCRFSDFIFNLLITKGAKTEEIFYTTREVEGNSELAQNIKNSLMESTTMVLFLDSVNFHRSPYCLFEGGAFWATRSIESCIHIHFDTSWIPDYINDRKKYHVPLNMGQEIGESVFELTPKKYNELVDVLNIMIDHLNRSAYHNEQKIASLERVKEYTPAVKLKASGADVTEGMDKDFVLCWNFYIRDGESDKDKDGVIIPREEYIKKYNESVEKSRS